MILEEEKKGGIMEYLFYNPSPKVSWSIIIIFMIIFFSSILFTIIVTLIYAIPVRPNIRLMNFTSIPVFKNDIEIDIINTMFFETSYSGIGDVLLDNFMTESFYKNQTFNKYSKDNILFIKTGYSLFNVQFNLTNQNLSSMIRQDLNPVLLYHTKIGLKNVVHFDYFETLINVTLIF